MIAAYIVGVITGASIVWLSMRMKFYTAHEPAAHLYGHRWPPTKVLRKKLPKPLAGYAWEINVDTDDQGQYIMHLTLVNVATGKNVATTCGNLTWRNYESWSRTYIEFSHIAKDVFATDLINPMVDWAIATNNKLNPLTASDYTLE